MRILHAVEFYHPSTGGAQEVVRRVSEALVARGHDVTVATTRLPDRRDPVIRGVRIEGFGVSGSTARGISGEAERYRRFLLDGPFDVVMCYAAQQWATDLALPLLGQLTTATVVATCGFSGLFWPEFREYFERMPGWLARADHVILHGESVRDARFARDHGIDRCTIIPNGAAAAEFAAPEDGFRIRHGIPANQPLLLTVGSHTRSKGHALAVSALLRARVPRATLVIVGNTLGTPGCLPHCRRLARVTRLRSLGRKRVVLLDPPRDEVVAAFKAADLFVFGSTLECSPLVLFEAAAAGTPFVASPCGNAAEIAAWLGHGLVVDGTLTPDGFTRTSAGDLAAGIDAVLADLPTWRDRAGAARERWRRDFTWESIAGRYEAVYEAAVARRRG